MFGYVKVYQPELKMGEFEQYRGVYCSLCKQLGKRYGVVSRLTLSYDFNFLALFCVAMEDGCAGFHKGRCLFNPLKKRTCCAENAQIAFAADAATILMYFKLLDTVADNRLFKSLGARLLLPFASRARKKAKARQPSLYAVVERCIQAQTALEKASTSSIDAAAEPSAQMLAAMAETAARTDKERQILQRFGYCLGRWIYLVDAVDDLPDDLKDGNYNPYIVSRGITDEQGIAQTRTYALQSLNACLAECIAAYNLLSINRFDGILRNVLELGMPAVQRTVLEGRDKDKTKRDGTT